jgi:hypothetical protein
LYELHSLLLHAFSSSVQSVGLQLFEIDIGIKFTKRNGSILSDHMALLTCAVICIVDL